LVDGALEVLQMQHAVLFSDREKVSEVVCVAFLANDDDDDDDVVVV
jgi:hypothetical protein